MPSALPVTVTAYQEDAQYPKKMANLATHMTNPRAENHKKEFEFITDKSRAKGGGRHKCSTARELGRE
jgi:hypothetical protein